jgi:hypothetical protein
MCILLLSCLFPYCRWQLEGKTAEECDEFVDKEFDALNEFFHRRSEEMRAYVKSKKPVRADFATEEEYEREVSDYKTLVSAAGVVLKKLMAWFEDLWNSVKTFFKSLWNWIKTKVRDIGKCVLDFLSMLKGKFERLGTVLGVAE